MADCNAGLKRVGAAQIRFILSPEAAAIRVCAFDSRGPGAIRPATYPGWCGSSALADSFLRAKGLTMSHSAHLSMANAIRSLAMDAVEQAKSGHP
ncbi:MAG: hypothetical protein ACRCYS_19905, partial [Beijerinckiaceae bacterium]